MDAKALRTWLIQQPRPASVRATSADGVPNAIAIDPAASWVATAESIAALDPTLVEALDDKGTILRAKKAADLDPEGATNAGTAGYAARARSDDPETQRLIVFAGLLAEAYKHSNEIAFARLVDMFDAVNKRSEALEKSLATSERIMRKTWEDSVLQRAEGEGSGSLLEQLIAGYAQGQMQGKAEKAANGVNGAVHHDEEDEGDAD